MEETQSQLSITLVMPALNEEANIVGAVTRCLEAFGRLAIDGEVLVVNDGSRDRTPELVENLKAGAGKDRVRMISHPSPQGIGASFRDGVAASKARAVAMMPGDNENDPSEILRYLPLLDHVDLVVPFVFNKEVRGRRRNLYSSIYLFLVNLAFGLKFNYTNGTVLYHRCVLEDSPNRSNGFFFQTENLVRAVRRGYLFAEVPYRLDLRETGESKATSWASLKIIIRDFLALLREVHCSPAPPPPAAASAAARRAAGFPNQGKEK